MKQMAKVLSINIDSIDLINIRMSFLKMIAGTDLQRMTEVLNILHPNRKTILSPALLAETLEMCYNDIIESLGPKNPDGSLDVDLLDYPSAGCGSLGFILKLEFDKDQEYWLWTLNLEVSEMGVYESEEGE